MFELTARLVAGVVPALQRPSLFADLSNLVSLIFDQHGVHASERERLAIEKSSWVRYRLIHLESLRIRWLKKETPLVAPQSSSGGRP